MGLTVQGKIKFTKPSEPRNATNKIIIHHAGSAGDISAQEIHRQHLAKGWRGIGYHYVVRYDGTVESGRPENTIGAHAEGHNFDSIGICLAGNIDKQPPIPAQMLSLARLVLDILKRYPRLQVIRHRDVNATACPGKLFPWEEFRKVISGGEKVEKTKILLNALGKKIELDGIIYNGKTYVEARKLFEFEGKKVIWNPEKRMTEVRI